MAKLVQCVPNFSEGRRPEVVKSIADAIAGSDGVRLIDYSHDVDHNRSVITFIGSPEAVRAAMLSGARIAVDTIDLREHTGGHPRIGAIDVVPVVPLVDCDMADCVQLSYEIGEDFARQLGIPVYFYAHSAKMTHRTALPDVRKGGFERLQNAELVGELAPDVGPLKVHPTAGASAIGARDPLIAFNVNLDTDRLDVANEIAKTIRQVRRTGRLAGVRAIGVELKSRGIVQVSTNITETDKTSMYDVFNFVESEASKHGVKVLECELIGAIRQDVVIETLKKSMHCPTLTRERVLDEWF